MITPTPNRFSQPRGLTNLVGHASQRRVNVHAAAGPSGLQQGSRPKAAAACCWGSAASVGEGRAACPRCGVAQTHTLCRAATASNCRAATANSNWAAYAPRQRTCVRALAAADSVSCLQPCHRPAPRAHPVNNAATELTFPQLEQATRRHILIKLACIGDVTQWAAYTCDVQMPATCWCSAASWRCS
jgi:hypothetical protein